MTTTIADHKHDVCDTGGGACGDVWHIQVDHHAAGAVGIDLVGAGLLPGQREIVASEVVSSVIALGQIALTGTRSRRRLI